MNNIELTDEQIDMLIKKLEQEHEMLMFELLNPY